MQSVGWPPESAKKSRQNKSLIKLKNILIKISKLALLIPFLCLFSSIPVNITFPKVLVFTVTYVEIFLEEIRPIRMEL